MKALLIWLLMVTPAFAESGVASWYERGKYTASGQRYAPDGMTAAHRTHKFGTRLKVTDIATGRSVVVHVNDRGPAKWTGRVIDLSRGAARQLGIMSRGLAKVHIEVLR